MATRRAHSTAASGGSRWLAPCRKGRSPRGYPVRVRVFFSLPQLYARRARLTTLDFAGVWWGAEYVQVRRFRPPCHAPRRRRRALAHSAQPTAPTLPTARAARAERAGGRRPPLGGVPGGGGAARLEHRDIGHRVAVGEASLEVVAALVGERLDGAGLLLGVRVVLDGAGVLAVDDLELGGDH